MYVSLTVEEDIEDSCHRLRHNALLDCGRDEEIDGRRIQMDPRDGQKILLHMMHRQDKGVRLTVPCSNTDHMKTSSCLINAP
jgi:hypothetical protein